VATETLKKRLFFLKSSDWRPKTVVFGLKEKILWPFKNNRQKISVFFLITLFILTIGLFNFLLEQKKAKALISIASWEDLDSIRGNLSGNYVLDISLNSGSPGYDDYAGPSANSSQGWIPIGNNIDKFTGTFDGQGHEINDLYIDRSTDYVGFFGYTSDASTVENIGFKNISIEGRDYVGGLIGYNEGDVIQSYVEGDVNGENYVGGLIGYSRGEINRSYSSGNTTGINNGSSYIGGLVGFLFTSLSTAKIDNSYSRMNVTGGLVTGEYAGGLVGYNSEGTINYSYAGGSVSGNNHLGGLVGENICPGYGCENIFNSFYDQNVSGQSDTGKGTPKATAEMKNVRTFTDVVWSGGLNNPWDFVGNPFDDVSNNDFWDIDGIINDGYPFLAAFAVLSPSLSTYSASSVFQISAVANGQITSTGGENASTRGFKFYDGDTCVQNESDISQSGSFDAGSYSLQITGLLANTTYSYKAYAINSAGTGEGSCVSFLTSSSISLPDNYSIVLETFPEEGGTVSGAGTYAEGASVSINATPNEGYSFISWKEGDEVISTNQTYSFSVSSNRTFVANFEREGYLIRNLPEGLSVFDYSTDEDLTVVPKLGEVVSILKKGESPIARINIDFQSDLDWENLKANSGIYSLNAENYGRAFVHFKDRQQMGVTGVTLLIPSVKGNNHIYICPMVQTFESINENCSGIYYLNISPINGFYEVEILNTGGAEKPDIVKYTVSLSVSHEERGTTDGSGEYLKDENVTVRAFPNEGYDFLNWTEENLIVSSSAIYSFSLNSSRNLRANFSVSGQDLVFGCTDPNAINYNPNANTEDNSCQYDENGNGSQNQIFGCTDPNAINYNPNANTEDNSCQYEKEPSVIPVIPTVEEVVKKTKEFIDSPEGKTATRVVSTTGAVAGTASLVASAIFVNPFSFSNLFFTLLRLWSLFLTLIGLKKRHKPWGTVYDSITKQPLDPAYVFLQDIKGEIISDSITDLDGRYGFLVKPGNYKIVANKTNYTFPSKKLEGKDEDGIYDRLYFGETLDIENEEEVIAKNIPMDPIGFDWNEFAKREKNKMKFYSGIDRFFSNKIVDLFFFFGFFVAVIAYFFAPHPYNLIILFSYIFLFILRKIGLKPKAGGYVMEKDTGFPLSFAVIKIFLPDIDKEILRRVASKTGKYFCLVPPGVYYVKVEKKNDDGSYSHVYTSSNINAKKGIIKEDFKV